MVSIVFLVLLVVSITIAVVEVASLDVLLADLLVYLQIISDFELIEPSLACYEVLTPRKLFGPLLYHL